MNYLDRLRPEFPEKTDLEIELWLCTVPDIEKKTGLTQHDHRMKAMALLWPTRVPHAWRERVIEGYNRCRLERRKEYLLCGSSNSNKTSTLADLALELWWQAPEATTVYIASPYKEATQTGLWARIIEQFDDATSSHSELRGRLKPSENKILLYERNPLSFIQVVTVDEIGKLVGKKSKNFAVGQIIIIIDEAPELPNNGAELLKVLSNLRSVPNFMLIAAGNFADPNDAMGKLCEPVGGYEAIRERVDDAQEWLTRRGGLCYRFDGHQSPNVKAGKDIYPFVTTIEYLKDLAQMEGGTRSAGYFRFGRSFPQMDLTEFTVTNFAKIAEGNCEMDFEWTADPIIEIAFADVGFGGDPGYIQPAKLGWATINNERRQMLELHEPPAIIPLEIGKKDETGREVSSEKQTVRFCQDFCEGRAIPPENFGFDGSMRASIVQEFLTEWSLKVIPLDFGGVPTIRPMSSSPDSKRWKDEVDNFVSELWFACASIIQSGQIRGLQRSPEAKRQLCARRWRWIGKRRKQIEPKPEFKKNNDNKSPNEADALVGVVEIARRRGFRLLGVQSGMGAAGAIMDFLAKIKQNSLVKRFLKNELPPGTLHGIQSRDTKSRGHLHAQRRL